MTKNITFTLPAEAMEAATEALLLGDFNNWNPEKAPKLERQPDGSFEAVAQLEPGQTYHYRFLLNDGRWVNDYNAQSYVDIPGLSIENCIITIPDLIVEENEIIEPVKAKAKTKKAAKAETNTTEQFSEDAEQEKIKTTEEKAPKAVEPKAKKTVITEKVEKPAKAVKKSALKEKK
ncbi:MAG: isoamylase early set domain-containing protein [Bacteroidota bacterium]|nr:isoamylase early set domain-containing protein [Bacteroidota bacterium]